MMSSLGDRREEVHDQRCKVAIAEPNLRHIERITRVIIRMLGIIRVILVRIRRTIKITRIKPNNNTKKKKNTDNTTKTKKNHKPGVSSQSVSGFF